MRSESQNNCLHRWLRDIAKHLMAHGVSLWLLGEPERVVKRLVKRELGNGERMSTTKYVITPADLQPEEIRAGIISMAEFLTKIEAWAAMDLGLNLVRE